MKLSTETQLKAPRKANSIAHDDDNDFIGNEVSGIDPLSESVLESEVDEELIS